MTYSRSRGVSLAACGAQTCRCDKSHVGALGGREKPVRRFDLSHDCAICGSSSIACDQCPNGCCDACYATGGCTHENPMQATYDTTRSDA